MTALNTNAPRAVFASSIALDASYPWASSCLAVLILPIPAKQYDDCSEGPRWRATWRRCTCPSLQEHR